MDFLSKHDNQNCKVMKDMPLKPFKNMKYCLLLHLPPPPPPTFPPFLCPVIVASATYLYSVNKLYILNLHLSNFSGPNITIQN